MGKNEISMVSLQKNNCIRRKGLSLNTISPDREMYELYCEKFDKNRFEKAFEKLCKMHPMLLASFDIDRELQIVDFETKIPIIYKQMNTDYYNAKAERESILCTIFKLAFIGGTALQKIYVLCYIDGSASIITLTDGLGIDGESQEILIRDLGQLYEGKKISPECNYKNFFRFLNQKNKEKRNDDIQYWENKITTEMQGYSINKCKNHSDSKETKFVIKKIPPKLCKHLQQVAGKNFMSLYALLFATYLRILDRYSNMDKFLISMPVSIRDYELDDIENTVGMLTDFVPFPYEAKKESLLDTAQRIQEQLWEIQEHNAVSGADILKIAQEKQKQQIKLGWSFTAIMSSKQNEKCPFKRKSVRVETGSLDVETVIFPDEEGMLLMMTYRTEYVKDEMIHRLCSHFMELLFMIPFSEHKEGENEIPLYSKDKEIIQQVNETECFLGNLSLQNLIRESMDCNSKKIALITEEKNYSYKELNEMAVNIANKLLDFKRNDKECRIGIFMGKGVGQIIMALAAIYSNISYMPIETTLPMEDINYCINQADISLVITDEILKKKTKNIICNVKTYLEVLTAEEKEKRFVNKKNTKNDITIIINTSGTTGHPKSVLVKEDGIINCLIHSKERFQLKEERNVRAIAVTNFCHDMALYDYLGMFVIGGSVVLPDYARVKDPKYLLELIQKYHVTFWNSVPAMIEMVLMLEDDNMLNAMKNIRRIVLGGDWIRTNTVRKLFQYSPEAFVYSVGGPTETTIWNISYKICKEDLEREYIPYGKPFANTKYHIFDKRFRKCPIGVPGIMYIEGVGVAKGYAGNAKETKKHFRQVFKKYMYESGDKGMYLPDGNIRFMGRMDNQIKINGKRIELSGIERKVNEIPTISTNCCIVHKKSGHLTLFYEGNIEQEEVREILKTKLVSYMIPSIIQKLDCLPLTYNGKPDRKKLALCEFQKSQNKKAENVNQHESKVLQILAEVLKVDQVSLEDNYYYLGGDSVTAMQFISKLYHEMAVELEIYDILGNPDIIDWMPLIKEKLDALEKENSKKNKFLNICRNFFENDKITEDMSFDEMGGNETSAYKLAEKIGLTEFQLLSLPWIDCWNKMLVKK